MAGAGLEWWRSGRGALGRMKPLLGDWATDASGPGGTGTMHCTRSFALCLGNSHVMLNARWQLGPSKTYEEIALFGKATDGLVFHSFTSDGKRSNGVAVDAPDVHALAVAFEADMPAGRARMLYWPAEDGALFFAVESRTQKGWNRFLQHRYHRTAPNP
ncbi:MULTISPECIES: hypothetical protein [Sphingomonas]|uniref:hypothetical protein n=1 Tax=Sphingomonas TaxID=13687 RepID=UPI00082AA6AB|nr:hypothetical protein [Sphingomonas sp. CCH10-B3]